MYKAAIHSMAALKMPIDELKEERGGCRDINMTLEVDWILIDEGVTKPKDGSVVKTNSTLVAT